MVTPSVLQRWCDITYGCVTFMYVVYVHTNDGTYALSVSLHGWMPCNATHDFINDFSYAQPQTMGLLISLSLKMMSTMILVTMFRSNAT